VAGVTDVVSYTVSVDAPEGYTVEVEPEKFTIVQGAEVSYEVTITNVSAPIGEWSFGSLTWSGTDGADGVYNVFSPIAVKGALLGAPAEVKETGEMGSGAFDVSFGYSGEYTAAPHGLDAALVTADSVPQDPDQDFDPDDGFSNSYEYELSGDAYFRMMIPPDGVANPDVDLDMFLFDPTGTQVAASTSGGTDEQIDVILPMDGTWTLYVHGWQTVDPTADFTLYTWIVSATPGDGNLSITSQPADAVLAAVGTVEYAWTGAMPEWYLGAVSHSNADGLLSLTLIDVDNRP